MTNPSSWARRHPLYELIPRPLGSVAAMGSSPTPFKPSPGDDKIAEKLPVIHREFNAVILESHFNVKVLDRNPHGFPPT